MTKHRKKEERISDILEAAAEEICSEGYAALTMDTIASRTELSKGGVYRFFSNKKDVALALFSSCYQRSLHFDIDEALGWNLPIAQTIHKILFRARGDEVTLKRDNIVWLQLLPETLWDQRFKAERFRLLDLLKEKFGRLARELLKRDNLLVENDLEEGIETALMLGVALFEGLSIQSSGGLAFNEQAKLVERFTEIIVNEAVGVK